MDKNVRELAEKIEKTSLEYGQPVISNDLAWVIAEALDNAGYIKPTPSEQSQDIEQGIVDILNVWKDEGKAYVDETSFKEVAHEISSLFNSQQQKVAGENK